MTLLNQSLSALGPVHLVWQPWPRDPLHGGQTEHLDLQVLEASGDHCKRLPRFHGEPAHVSDPPLTHVAERVPPGQVDFKKVGTVEDDALGAVLLSACDEDVGIVELRCAVSGDVLRPEEVLPEQVVQEHLCGRLRPPVEALPSDDDPRPVSKHRARGLCPVLEQREGGLVPRLALERVLVADPSRSLPSAQDGLPLVEGADGALGVDLGHVGGDGADGGGLEGSAQDLDHGAVGSVASQDHDVMG